MRKTVRIVLHLAVFAVSALFLIQVLRKAGIDNIREALGRCNWWYLPPAFLATTGRFISWNLKWQILNRAFFPIRFFRLFTMLMAGAFTNTVVPGTRAGGGLIRAYFLSRSSGQPFPLCYGGVLLDGAFNMAAFVLLTLCALPFVASSTSLLTPTTSVPTGLLALTVVLFAGLLALIHRRKRKETGIAPLITFLHHLLPAGSRRKRFPTAQELQGWLQERFREFLEAFRSLPNRRGTLWFSFLLALMVYGFLFLCNDLLFRSFDRPIGILPIVAGVTLSSVLGTFFMTPGGIGVADAALVGVYLAFGVEADLAVAVTILYRGLVYAHTLVGGLPCLIFLQWKYGRVRKEVIEKRGT